MSVPPISPTLTLQLSKKTITATMAPSLNSKPLVLQFLLLTLFILGTRLHASDPVLKLDYYASTCPTLLEIIKKEMECAVLADPRNAALILRLHFHDCFVQVYIFIPLHSLLLLTCFKNFISLKLIHSIILIKYYNSKSVSNVISFYILNDITQLV